jgi:hypothetical protein
MAKRHHDSKSHHRASERAHHRMGMAHGEHYAGMEPRRRQEMEDMGMIREDHSAVANLPQGVMMKPYRKEGGYLPEDLDDTIRGIEHQMDYDNGKKMQNFYPKKV